MKKLVERLHLPNWLTFILLIVFILRIPTFFEPFYYGDETIYLTLGEGIKQGVPLYKGLHDNKPPLIYLIAALAGNVFWFKVILAVSSFAGIILFWKLSRSFFGKNEKFQKVSTLVFSVLSTIPLFEGNIANAEMFMITLSLAAIYVLWGRVYTPKNLLLSGVLFSLAALFKVPAAFELPAIIIYWLIITPTTKENLMKTGKNSFYLVAGFVVPIVATLVWYQVHGSLGEYISAVYFQNASYLSSWRPGDVARPFIQRNLPLIIRSLVALASFVVIFLSKKKLSKEFSFLSIWLVLALFAVTLSERPYPHYFLQALAPLSFFVGMLVSFRTYEQVLAIIPLTIAFFVPFYFHFWYYSTTSYYSRFLGFITGNITKEEYFARFDKNVNRNYKIADFLAKSTRRKDRVFVWGDSSTIYALSRRLPPLKYVANYHLKDFSSPEELIISLLTNKPKVIVILPEERLDASILTLAHKYYMLLSKIEGAEIWYIRSN